MKKILLRASPLIGFVMRDSDLTNIPIQNSKHQIQIHKEKK